MDAIDAGQVRKGGAHLLEGVRDPELFDRAAILGEELGAQFPEEESDRQGVAIETTAKDHRRKAIGIAAIALAEQGLERPGGHAARGS